MRLGEMTGEERRPLVFEAEEPSLPSATAADATLCESPRQRRA